MSRPVGRSFVLPDIRFSGSMTLLLRGDCEGDALGGFLMKPGPPPLDEDEDEKRRELRMTAPRPDMLRDESSALRSLKWTMRLRCPAQRRRRITLTSRRQREAPKM